MKENRFDENSCKDLKIMNCALIFATVPGYAHV